MQAQIVNIPDADFKDYLLNYQQAEIDINQDGEIQVLEALAVESLDISPSSAQEFESLDGLNSFTNLTYLSITCSVASVDLSGLNQLLSLSIHDEALTDLNLANCTSLSDLNLLMVQLTSLDLSVLPNLTTVFVEGDSLNSLVIGNLNQLNGIWVMSQSLAVLDFSECPNLGFVHLTLNHQDKDVFINLKNGNAFNTPDSSAIYLTPWEDTSHIAYVCIDEGEAEFIEYLDEDVVLSTYCSLTPGGSYNIITGTFLYDNESDGCDTFDGVVNNVSVAISGAETGLSAGDTGLYNFYTGTGTFVVTPQLENEWFTISPEFAELSFTAVDSIVATHNFCITPNGVHPDVEVLIVPVSTARPGFEATYKVVARNKGNQTLTGIVTFTYEEDKLDFISSSQIESSIAPGTINWNYTLSPFEDWYAYVNMLVNTPQDEPPVNIDDELVFLAGITPLTADETPVDNTFELSEIVVGSFDPNDITCLEGPTASPEKIGDYLHYNINFENTGTAPASFIVVKDIIDAEQFDISSLQLIEASHNVNIRVEENKAEFYFDDINLGAQQKGNVVFKIKTLNTLQVNDDVTQQAEIFFDYNWPIETNEATTVFQVLSRGSFAMDYSVSVYPNPSAAIVNIVAGSTITSVQLYDMQGRLLQAMNGNDLTAALDISMRASGIYFIKVATNTGMKIEQIVKK